MHPNLKKQAMPCLFLTLHGWFSWFYGTGSLLRNKDSTSAQKQLKIGTLRNPNAQVINLVIETHLSHE